METFETCSIDIEDMSAKVTGAVFSSKIDLLDPSESVSAAHDLVTSVFLAFGEDDEQAADAVKLVPAATNIFKCIAGMYVFPFH